MAEASCNQLLLIDWSILLRICSSRSICQFSQHSKEPLQHRWSRTNQLHTASTHYSLAVGDSLQRTWSRARRPIMQSGITIVQSSGWCTRLNEPFFNNTLHTEYNGDSLPCVQMGKICSTSPRYAILHMPPHLFRCCTNLASFGLHNILVGNPFWGQTCCFTAPVYHVTHIYMLKTPFYLSQ